MAAAATGLEKHPAGHGYQTARVTHSSHSPPPRKLLQKANQHFIMSVVLLKKKRKKKGVNLHMSVHPCYYQGYLLNSLIQQISTHGPLPLSTVHGPFRFVCTLEKKRKIKSSARTQP